MYPNDPTLYGVNLPQRDIPVTPYPFPFIGANLPMQALPWQSYQRYIPQFPPQVAPQTPAHATQPFLPQATQPFLPQTGPQFPPFGLQQFYGQGYGFPQQMMSPFIQQGGYTPWTPPYAYQRPFWF